MIKQLLNSVITKYRDMSVSHRSIINLSLQLCQIIDLLGTDKSNNCKIFAFHGKLQQLKHCLEYLKYIA